MQPLHPPSLERRNWNVGQVKMTCPNSHRKFGFETEYKPGFLVPVKCTTIRLFFYQLSLAFVIVSHIEEFAYIFSYNYVPMFFWNYNYIIITRQLIDNSNHGKFSAVVIRLYYELISWHILDYETRLSVTAGERTWLKIFLPVLYSKNLCIKDESLKTYWGHKLLCTQGNHSPLLFLTSFSSCIPKEDPKENISSWVISSWKVTSVTDTLTQP